jgi:hypothetical protein
MTPRALLTTIGATAIAFALAIGAAAGSASSTPTVTNPTSVSRDQPLVAHAALPHLARAIASGDSGDAPATLPASHRTVRTAQWNTACVIAL